MANASTIDPCVELSHPIYERVIDLCSLFEERASEVDTGGPMNPQLRDNIRHLADSGYFGSGIAKEFGGHPMPDHLKRDSTERLAAACGATAFAQQQLHGGGGFVSGARSDVLKDRLLPKFANGKEFCGVGFSQLRRSGPPVCTAREQPGGSYLVNGSAPWVSVWSLLDSFILGATIESTGELLFCYVNIRDAGQALHPSEPMQLAVMTAADTVICGIENLIVPAENVLFINEPNSMKDGDFRGITGHITMPLGCAIGSARYLASLDRDSAKRSAEQFFNEINECRSAGIYWNGSRADEPDYRERALHARATAINLALRSAEASIAASGGRAHLLTHPAQRRLREAGFYATMAQTADTQSALLEMFTYA